MSGISATYMTLAAGATTTGGALWLAPDCISNWSMQVVTTGTLTGAFRFYESNDMRARPDHPDRANAVWHEFTSEVASQWTNPAGGAVVFRVKGEDQSAQFMRMDYVHTSGTGTVSARFSGRSG